MKWFKSCKKKQEADPMPINMDTLIAIYDAGNYEIGDYLKYEGASRGVEGTYYCKFIPITEDLIEQIERRREETE